MTPGVQITLIICVAVVAVIAIIAFSPESKNPKK